MLVEEIPGSAAVTVDGQPRYDLPRNSQNVAIIGDPRNDENLIVSQLHLAMLRFHNAVVGRRQGRSRRRADRRRRCSPRPSGSCAGTTSG